MKEPPDLAELRSRLEQADALFPAQPVETLEALASVESELEASNDDALIAKYLLLKGNALTQAGRLEEALAHIDEAEPRLVAMGQEREILGMLNLRGVLAHRASNYVESIHYYRQALERAQGIQAPELLANLTGNLGLNLAYLGDFAGALALLEESLDQWRILENPAGIIPTLINLGFTSSNAGMPEAALSYYAEAYARAVEAGDTVRQALSLGNWSSELSEAGASEEAREKAALAVALARQQPAGLPLAYALESWALVEDKAGNLDGARAVLEEALEHFGKAGNRRGIAKTELHLARLGGPDRAQRLERGLSAAREASLKPEQARCLGELAILAREAGELEKAFDLLTEARDLDRALFDEEAQRRVAAVKVKREIEALQLELASERIRRTEMAELLDEVQVQRQLAEEESRQKSAILQIAAHDLRGMTSSVIGCLDLASHGLDTAEQTGMQRELVDDARTAAQELFELLLRLMDMAAIERGAMSIEMEEIAMADAVRPILKRWKQTIETKEQELTVALDAGVRVRADPDRLRQMTANLLSNASKYSPFGGDIEMRIARAPGNRIRLSVFDHGPGLSAEDQKRMFRPFQVLSARPTGGEQSTGLGLHIVKALAEKQGATLGYASRPGGGSEFYFEFNPVPSGVD